ncbi:lysophospholipid acyltransferase family protein [Winogradskya consettensis]|uniref:1-acyl-sn-glycerol-3-phosphate acyltransferase n=1 Tax=Winogradskya consettensis TaxID=113560 RepID=A0A919SML1_9ACTN|nr:lysophospholipid acyltransferase family protein [Actinoplanes consettensis]GIM74840.1 1-acyl-sn-glycerol-3-phosphate acyltransferase [Actinoplanes consettensis]
MLIPHLVRAALVPVSRLAFRPTIEGLAHLPVDGPVIVAANHISALDSFLIPLVSPRPVFFLAKEEYFTGSGPLGTLTRTAISGLGAIPVPRGGHRAAQAALEASLAVLKDGRAFGIHPEGTRSRDGRLYRGRTGVAWLAMASGAPVVPAALIGTDRVHPVGTLIPRPGKVTVRFGEPLHFPQPAGSAAKARREATDQIMDAIAALSGQDRADTYNEVSSSD